MDEFAYNFTSETSVLGVRKTGPTPKKIFRVLKNYTGFESGCGPDGFPYSGGDLKHKVVKEKAPPDDPECPPRWSVIAVAARPFPRQRFRIFVPDRAVPD